MTLLKLCFVFFYIGLFTIGGGMVAITLMQQELMEKGLITPERFANMLAISESTPGPIGVNMATYIGCELYGVGGGILATFFTVLPSLIVIMLVARFFARFEKNPFVTSAFTTIKPVVAGLIAVATWNVIKIVLFPPLSLGLASPIALAGTDSAFWSSILTWLRAIDLPSIIFFALGIVLLALKKMHPVLLIALGAFFGVVFL